MGRAFAILVVLVGLAGCLGKFEPMEEDFDPRGLKDGEKGLLTGDDGVFQIDIP